MSPSGRRAILFAPALATLPARGRAQAPWSPSRPVRLVVPYAAGGPLDAMARILAERLSPRLGQPIAVENRAGGAGVVGVDAVAKSAPDGHTLLATALETQINNAVLIRGLPYDPRADFTLITRPVTSSAVLAAPAALGARNLEAFTALARSRGDLAYGSWGQGGMGHLMAATLDRRLGWNLPHTPYRGAAPLLTDLLAGTVSLGFAAAAAARPHLERGTLVAYAVAGPVRARVLPDVPTLAELGHADPILRVPIWYGLLGPANLPAAVTARLATEVAGVLASPDGAAAIAGLGLDPLTDTPAAFAADFARDFEAIAAIIRDLAIEPA